MSAVGGKRKVNPALLVKFTPDAKLEAVVGKKPRSRSEFVKDIWTYIKKHKLQDPKNGQHILCKKDAKLHALTGKDMITMFEVMVVINKHISETKEKSKAKK